LKRQIFFVSIGGFDTHNGEINGLGNLMTQLNQAMSAFYYWLQNDPAVQNPAGMGNVGNNVTTCTLFELSRTLNPSGTGAATVGTDHAWASNQLVLGGSVNGGDFYGIPVPSTRGGNDTVFHSLVKSGAYDTDTRGRWIPSVGVDLYAHT